MNTELLSSARRLGAVVVLALMAALLVPGPAAEAAPAQRITVTLRGPLEIRSPLTVRSVFRPVRPGRPWRIERRVNGAWQRVTSGRQPRSGVVTRTVRTPRSAGRFAVRVVAPAWRGLRAVSRTSTVTLHAVPVRRVGPPRLVTSAASGTAADGFTGGAVTSDGGRWVVFASTATDLVPGPADGTSQVYLRDTVAGTTVRISSSTTGGPGDAASHRPQVSRDGRFVTFASDAGDLVTGDGNDNTDVFLYDRVQDEITLLSALPEGGAAGAIDPCLSPSARYVGFSTASALLGGDPGNYQVVRLDRRTGELRTVSRNADGDLGDGWSLGCEIADDGSVLFNSGAGNLAQGDTEGSYDLYLWNPATGPRGLTLRTPGGDTNGDPGGYELSPDGRTVLLISRSQLLPEDTDSGNDLYRYRAGAADLELLELDGVPAAAFPSDDPTRIAYATWYPREDAERPWGPLVPRVTELGSGLSGPVAVRPDGVETDDDRTNLYGFSADGTAVLYTTTDPALVGRDPGAFPQLVLQRLEPLQ